MSLISIVNSAFNCCTHLHLIITAAKSILNRGADGLMDSVAAVVRKLGLEDEEFPVSLVQLNSFFVTYHHSS